MTPAARFVCRTCGATSQSGGTCERGHDALADAGDDALLGTEVGGYRITRPIGRGGMGAVYRAVQPAIDAEVAIKILAADLASDPESTERFIAEAKTANLVRHEALVKVIGLGVLPDGRPYQVMEHLTGVPLVDVIYDHATRPLGTLIERLADSLRAIHVMHARGIVHRDLKPSNLFATTAGFLKVLDFGIAKLAEHRSGLTRTGHAIGTPGYMSPEQASAEKVDARTDIYAMGVVLFEAIAKRRPFEGRVVEALALSELPPPLAGTLPEATPELDAVIAKAMAIDPAARYQDAEEMARALDAAAHAMPASAFGPLLDDELVARASGPRVVPSTAPSIPTAPPTVGSPRAVPEETRRATPNALADAETQKQLGRFVIERAVGEGGQGRVLLAIDPAIERKVALKLVGSGSEARRERMVAEARAMAKINHPNVVTLYELGEHDGQLFLAMEYLEAIDLARWLAERERPWREIVPMFVEAGRGLAAAHAVGITHRDFKPANVLLGKDGRPKVGDFGISTVGGDTEGGQGTLAYMPPEQLEGGTPDPRSDQFAFCASLWHALYGTPPFAKPDMSAVAIALAVHKGPPRPPERGEVPARIERALRRGLAADPAARFPSIAALLVALAPSDRRHRLAWIGATLAMFTAVTLAIALWPRPDPGPSSVEEPVLDLDQIAKLPPFDRLRAIARLPRSMRTSDAARSLAGDTVAVTGILRTITLPEEPFARTLAISASGRWIGVAIPGGIWLQAFDASGKRVSTLTMRSPPEPPRRLSIDERTGEIRALGGRAVYRSALGGGSWSVHRECSTGAIGLAVADPDLTRLHCVEPSGAPDVDHERLDLLFSTDGRYVVLLDPDKIVITDTRTPTSPVSVAVAPGAYVTVGARFAGIAEQRTLRVRDLDTGEELRWSTSGEALLRQVHLISESPLVALVRLSTDVVGTLERGQDGRLQVTQLTQSELGPLREIWTVGGRTIATLTDRIVVEDPAWGTSWELLGTSNAIVMDARATRFALLDGRSLRIWDVGRRPPVVIHTGLFSSQHQHATLIADGPEVPQLQWFDPDRPERPIATLDIPVDAQLIGGRGPGAFWRAPDGMISEWIPSRPPKQLGIYPGVGNVYWRGDQYFGLAHHELLDLATGKQVCADDRDSIIAVSLDARYVLAARGEHAVALCDPATGQSTPLSLTFDELVGMNFRFSSDGSLLFALPIGLGPTLSVAVFDTATGNRLPPPAFANGHVLDVDGTRDGVFVRTPDGTFWHSPKGTVRLHEPTAKVATTFDWTTHRIVHRHDRQITVWDVTGAPKSRVVARARTFAVMNGRVFSFPHAIGVEQRRASVPRGEITIWSLSPPSVEDAETWLSLAAD